jgi:hypothetical protein
MTKPVRIKANDASRLQGAVRGAENAAAAQPGQALGLGAATHNRGRNIQGVKVTDGTPTGNLYPAQAALYNARTDEWDLLGSPGDVWARGANEERLIQGVVYDGALMYGESEGKPVFVAGIGNGRIGVKVTSETLTGLRYPGLLAFFNAPSDAWVDLVGMVWVREAQGRHLTEGYYANALPARGFGPPDPDCEEEDCPDLPVYLVDNCCGEPPIQCLLFNPPSYSIDGEPGGSVTLTVDRSGGTTGTITVNYHTVDGTATAGTDYTSTSGTLTFNPAVSSQTFSVTVATHATMTGSLTFTAVLDTPSAGVTVCNPGTATITINPEDTPPPSLTVESDCCPSRMLPEAMWALFEDISGASAIDGLVVPITYEAGTAPQPYYGTASSDCVSIPGCSGYSLRASCFCAGVTFEGDGGIYQQSFGSCSSYDILAASGTQTIVSFNCDPFELVVEITLTGPGYFGITQTCVPNGSVFRVHFVETEP